MMLLNFFLCIDAAKRLMHVKHDAIMHIFHLTVKTVLSNAFASFPFPQKSTLSVNCRNSSYMLH